MINLVQILSTSIDSLNRRIPKFLRLGRKDIQTSLESSPYGVDSNPIEDIVAVYLKTGEKGKTVIVGYINKNQQSEPGEYRLFSTNADGIEQAYMWLRKNGNLELNGDDDNMVRFSELKSAFDELKSDFNSLVTAYNSHVHPGVTSGGASTAPTPSSGSSSTADISGAKIDEVKTLS